MTPDDAFHERAFHELCGYTLTRDRATFVHQHAVDAHAAQTATPATKPIKLTFALAGLYLHLERGFTGLQVQRAHMALARAKHAWPTFPLPADRGALTAADVLVAPPGPERDAAIDAWCAAVWAAYAGSHDAVAALMHHHGVA